MSGIVDPRLPHARDAADRGRDHGVAVDAAEGDGRGRAVRVRLRDSERHHGLAVSSAARASTTAARTSIIRSARASRRWTRSSCSTTCSCRGRTCCSTATWSAATRRYARTGAVVAHGASGRGQEHREVRVHARPRRTARRHDRRRGLPAHPGEARRDLGEPGDDEARCCARPKPTPRSTSGA